MLVRKLVNKGNVTENTRERYQKLSSRKDKVYDIFIVTESDKANQGKKRKVELEKSSGVPLSSNEYVYLESQKSDILRSYKLVCFPKKLDIDPAWKV